MKKLLLLPFTVLITLCIWQTAFAGHWADVYFERLESNSVLSSILVENIENKADQPMTRAEFFALISAVLFGQQKPMGFEYFADFDNIPKELTGYIKKAQEYGIVSGVLRGGSYYLLPDENITRQDAVTALGRSLGLSISARTSFADDSQISDYAFDYVCAFEKAGILSGDYNKRFNPLDKLTWAQACKIIVDVMEGGFASPAKISALAGDGSRGYKNGYGSEAVFNGISGISFYNGDVYIADGDNNKIRKVSGGYVSDVAGRILGYDIYGAAVKGYRDDIAGLALFARPSAVLPADDKVYVLDKENSAVRVIINNRVTTYAGAGYAGHGDGALLTARFNKPEGFCFGDGGSIYIADTGNNVIRKIDSSGIVTTIAGRPGESGLADGAADSALFYRPTKLAYKEGVLYISDSGNNRIRTLKDGLVSTFAGGGDERFGPDNGLLGGYRDGNKLSALFDNPSGICFGEDGTLYVADTGNSMVRAISKGLVYTVSGLGSPVSGSGREYYNRPVDVAWAGKILYVADSFKNTVISVEIGR